MDPFCYLCFVYDMLSCLFIASINIYIYVAIFPIDIIDAPNDQSMTALH